MPHDPERTASPMTGQKATPTADSDEMIAAVVSSTSPSGNVACQFGYGQGITMSAGGDAEFVCAGDTTLGTGQPLPYGESVSAGALRCDSAESGITCRDTESGRGFALSREGYEIF